MYSFFIKAWEHNRLYEAGETTESKILTEMRFL